MIKRDKITLERGFIIVLAVLISGIFLWMIRHYLSALFLAGVITLFLDRPQAVLTRWLGGRKRLAAALLVIFTLMAFFVPASLLLGVIADQAIDVAGMMTPWVQEQINLIRAEGLVGLPDWLPFRQAIIDHQDELVAQTGNLARAVSNFAVQWLQAGTGGVLAATLNGFILIYALFFFLQGGRKTGQRAMSMLPMAREDRVLLVERAVSTIRATVKGSFLIALVQGGLTGLGLLVAGVPGAIFWGAIAALLSIIPMIGPPLIWGPAALWLFATGQPIPAIGLAAWGMIVISSSDNILRPIFVGQDAKMSDLTVLLSTLGGLSLFGAVGIILGPVIAALFASVWYIFAETFEDLIDPDDAEPVIASSETSADTATKAAEPPDPTRDA